MQPTACSAFGTRGVAFRQLVVGASRRSAAPGSQFIGSQLLAGSSSTFTHRALSAKVEAFSRQVLSSGFLSRINRGSSGRVKLPLVFKFGAVLTRYAQPFNQPDMPRQAGSCRLSQTLRITKNCFAMKTALFLAAILASSVAHSQVTSDRAQKDDLVFMEDEEPAMRKAFAKAAESLDDFLAKAKAASPEHTSFSLKVAISEGEKTEYFWVNNFVQIGEDSFQGEIGNEPRMVKAVKFGQRYLFPRTHIVDWTYIDKPRRSMVGNFTLCALLTKDPKSEADAMKKRFKLNCDWLQ